ncbi:MAG: RNA methyltransferase [Clostridia bacterium]|nr:RNA methyltransferase [Clostridia bacterium]
MNTQFEVITSIKNPKIQHVKRLKDKAYRRSCGEFVVEGENFLKDLPSESEITAFFVEKDKFKEFEYIIKRYPSNRIFMVDSKVMAVMSDTVTPSGALAIVKINQVDETIQGNVAVLDGVSDPGNMGTIIRTCAACGVENIIAIDCVDHLSPKVIRASMGGIFAVKVLEKTSIEALKLLENHHIYALDMNGENLYSMEKIDLPFALVVGNESKGLSNIFRSKSKIISLPMSGKIESLNAGVSMSTALYEIIFGKNVIEK